MLIFSCCRLHVDLQHHLSHAAAASSLTETHMHGFLWRCDLQLCILPCWLSAGARGGKLHNIQISYTLALLVSSEENMPSPYLTEPESLCGEVCVFYSLLPPLIHLHRCKRQNCLICIRQWVFLWDQNARLMERQYETWCCTVCHVYYWWTERKWFHSINQLIVEFWVRLALIHVSDWWTL